MHLSCRLKQSVGICGVLLYKRLCLTERGRWGVAGVSLVLYVAMYKSHT